MPVTTKVKISCCGFGRRGDRLVNGKPVRSHRYNNNSTVRLRSSASEAVAHQPTN